MAVLDIKHLTTLRTIVETGSFRRAARKLGYTQSTITFQVQQLEEELSVRLFERIGRKMALSQAGREILPHVERVLQSVEELRCCGKDVREMRGVLRVAMPETLLIYKAQPILRAFRGRAPNVRLLVRAQNCYQTRSQLIDGEIDAAIHYEVGGEGDAIVSRPLKRFRQSLVASPALAPECRDFVTPERGLRVTLISNDRNCISQDIFNQYLKRKKILVENVMELWSIEAIKRSVVSDLGVAYLPTFAVEAELARGALIELPTELGENEITAVCSHHKNKWIGPALALFLRLVGEEMAA